MFDYEDTEALGKVASVDTTNVIVEVGDLDQLKRLQVNRLVVLQSSKLGQHLIGTIIQITRKKIMGGDADLEDEFIEQNLCRIALIGTFFDRVGELHNVFRRTLESVPEIDANCFALEGDHLTGFMQVLSNVEEGATPLTIRKIHAR